MWASHGQFSVSNSPWNCMFGLLMDTHEDTGRTCKLQRKEPRLYAVRCQCYPLARPCHTVSVYEFKKTLSQTASLERE